MISLLATTTIVGATLVNLEGGAHLTNAVVVIEGERIRVIEKTVPAGAEVLRADGLFLLPGLVNLHVHLGLVLPGKMEAELADETDAELALRMASNARKSLEAGKYADLIAVRSDPTRSVSALREIALVMKGGEVVLDRSFHDR